MKHLLRCLLLAASGLMVLTLGPVRAQETAPAEETPAPKPAESAPENAPPEAEPAPDEGLSADNSLSFPVDI